jgi:hypothetical protein
MKSMQSPQEPRCHICGKCTAQKQYKSIHNPQGMKDDEISYKSSKPKSPCVRIRHEKKKNRKLILNLKQPLYIL